MAPKSKKRVSEYDEGDDDGFVVDDEGSENESSRPQKRTKKSKADGNVPGGGSLDDDGSEYWEISKNRRLTISSFRGKYMVNLREYYEKDGKSLPGKKGISLPLEQYTTLIELLPHLETVLKRKGEKVPRPNYEGAAEDDKGNEENGQEEKEDKKANFEETSDEGE